MPATFVSADLGVAYAGLAGTIGVTVLDDTGAVEIARTTVGVFVVNKGCYGANPVVPDGFVGTAVFDISAGSDVYAVDEIDLGSTAPTVAEIVDGVLDEALAGHAVAGSVGEAIAAAGTAGDPWITSLPGAYGAGTAGRILGTFTTAGDGPHNVTVTITDSATSDPIQLAWVTLILGASRYSKQTDINGVAVLRPNEGNATYKVHVNHDDYDPMDEVDLIVSGATAAAYDLDLFVVTPSPPPYITGIIVAYDVTMTVKPGVVIKLQQIGIPTGDLADGVAFDGSVREATSGVNGVAQFVGLVPGATYQYQTADITRGGAKAVVPDDVVDGYQLGSIICR